MKVQLAERQSLRFFKNYENAEMIYEEALDLFENMDEHAAIINTRNYIEHF